MNTELNNETIVESAPVTNPSAKDKIMADGKITIWEYILIARYFLPILTTIGFVLSMIFNPTSGSFLDNTTMVLAIIGWISALTVSPLKILKFIWKSVAIGFKIVRGFIPYYGIADLCAAIFGVGAGLTFSLAVLAFVPAVFTITKFFNEEKF